MVTRYKRSLTVWNILLCLAAFTTVVVQAQARTVPDGELAVAYRQLQDGKLSQAVFQNWLECSNGECTWTTLILGQCIAGAFYPKIQRWTTREGSLSVRLISSG